ncbi:dephospho-CoA kinase [Nitrosospira sp. Nsp2]|uniref:dephospho-CoA kinase n=1 Tax=Nitrosospira sp. Nsp2 TaxID=136548 RepID=UPI000D312471|nr:dephospho-CoA kinase [Nitrosospira sp. Nsp2]PTR17045.1 dephospho-CoA kinase [Nitrosospira sp. Nsp2]
MSLVVGLTGGIGSGKTTAATRFAALGAGVVDTDAISHQLTQPGGAAISMIRQAFSENFLTPEGGLNRKEMRDLVFRDSNSRRKLEAILHPLIRTEVARCVGLLSTPYTIIVVPLLLETGSYRGMIRRVLVVDCSECAQIARATSRPGMDDKTVRTIMATQLSREERLAQADEVIVNDTDLLHLERQVDAVHWKYIALAAGC